MLLSVGRWIAVQCYDTDKLESLSYLPLYLAFSKFPDSTRIKELKKLRLLIRSYVVQLVDEVR